MTGSRRRWAVGAAAVVLLAVASVVFSGVDLWFSGLFWHPGQGFFDRDSWWAMALYRSVPVIAYVVVGLALLMLIANAVRRRPLLLPSRAILYVLVVVAVGPGLVVNVLFKDHWGRARPRDVVEFGGTATFTPAFVVSDQCPRNCSFVAGHPSMALALVALALLISRRRRVLRRSAVAAVLVFGLLVGLGRIVQGGHFLSDVVFSAIFTLTIAWGLYRLFGLDPPAADSPVESATPPVRSSASGTTDSGIEGG